jgi:predicted RNA-binding protein
MCETNAYVLKAGKEELYLENVNIMRPGEGRVYFKSIFGEEKVFEGRIKELILSKNKVILEEHWNNGDL